MAHPLLAFEQFLGPDTALRTTELGSSPLGADSLRPILDIGSALLFVPSLGFLGGGSGVGRLFASQHRLDVLAVLGADAVLGQLRDYLKSRVG